MIRPTLEVLAERSHKPGHPVLGTWLARRVARPAALRVTWVILPWGPSAHAATLAAWGLGLATAALWAQGTVATWGAAALVGWLWYLADHVDGQLARWHGPPSLDGAQLDYWMHHALNVAWPLGIGGGLAAASAETGWLWLGAVWAVALQTLGLEHDTRWKAIEQRLKRLHGSLELVGGGGGRPQPAEMPRGSTGSRLRWVARKLCELPVVLGSFTALAVAGFLGVRWWLAASQVSALVFSACALLAAARVVQRGLAREESERAFALWFRPRSGESLAYRAGWWWVDDEDSSQAS